MGCCSSKTEVTVAYEAKEDPRAGPEILSYPDSDANSDVVPVTGDIMYHKWGLYEYEGMTVWLTQIDTERKLVTLLYYRTECAVELPFELITTALGALRLSSDALFLSAKVTRKAGIWCLFSDGSQWFDAYIMTVNPYSFQLALLQGGEITTTWLPIVNALIKPQPDAVADRSYVNYYKLEAFIEQQKPQPEVVPSPQDAVEALTCRICLSAKVEITFGCGHAACSVCGHKIEICHLCKVPITTRHKLYL
ncbi:Ubiquitine ligase E3 [uncultured virus]|nr:Ubiquitine ligase E3 [uncultured virus]